MFIQILKKARQLGDFLLVGIHTDHIVRYFIYYAWFFFWQVYYPLNVVETFEFGRLKVNFRYMHVYLLISIKGFYVRNSL